MDSIMKAQKIEAMKNYKRARFLYSLIVYSLTAFLSCLFYLYLFWFPSAFINHFFSVLVPNAYSFFILSPNKLLFIVGNLIVLFLVGESKLGYSGGGGSKKSSSPVDEIYDEYVRRRRRRSLAGPLVDQHMKKHERVVMQGKNSSVKLMDFAEKEDKIENGGVVNNISYDVEEEEEKKQEVVDDDELKRRVEAFIDRVNRQMKLEES